MAAPLRRFVVFLASPGDLAEERQLAKEAIESVNRIGRYQGWHVELLMWEDRRPGAGRPQEIINRHVDECDLFVGLLWERWGQPTGKYTSGFEEEFERARTRRQNTDQPDIWLAFRKVDLSKLGDPGDDLKRVLAFRAKQVSQRELLFTEFGNPHEWRAKFSEWLLTHIAEVWTAPPAEPTGASASADGAAATPPAGPKNPDIERPTDLVDAARAFQRLIDEGDDPAERLTRFQIARLNLSATHLMTQVDSRVLLDVIGLNYLYRRRREVQPVRGERWLIYRTLIADRSDVMAGWYWLTYLTPSQVRETLPLVATVGDNAEARVRALEMMRELRIDPPGPEGQRAAFCDELLQDDAAEVRKAATEYLGAVGTAEESAALDRARGDADSEVRTAAAKAAFRIALRHDLDGAFALLLDGDRGADVELVRERAGELTVPQLTRALENGNANVRELAAAQLRERGALTGDLAVGRLEDASPTVRATAFEALIEQGLPVTAGQIRKAFAAERPPTLLTLRIETVNVDQLVLKLYRTLPYERLRAEAADWSSLTGAVAYRALGLDHFDRMEDQIRRDLGDRFASHEAAWTAAVRETLGDAFERLNMDQLRDFIRGKFEAAALEALAAHGDERDADVARRHLVESDDTETRRHAAAVLGRFGEAADVQPLLRVTGEAYGDLRVAAARAALALAPGPDWAAAELLAMHSESLTALVLQAWERESVDDVLLPVQDLLRSGDHAIRVKAASFLIARLPPERLEAVLDAYLEGYHYYNVVCWVDRALHAPAPLRHLYMARLERAGFRSASAW
jgi:HEAT repeat protein